MLEALLQTSAWLLRVTDDFAHSMVVLDAAKTVKYAGFVRPGQTLTLTSELKEREGDLATFKTRGTVDGEVAVRAQLVLKHFNLADQHPERVANDHHIQKTMREQLSLLYAEKKATT